MNNYQSRNILSVGQLNRQIKSLIEQNFQSIWVEGEISNLVRASSGHWYFTLKEQGAQVRCAMFRGSNIRVKPIPAEGDKVLIKAKASLYEARGDYQLIADHLESAGVGDLAKAFAFLRAQLQHEGLFDQDFKQDLPQLPNHVAIITSAKGAAIHDILSVFKRRFPAIQLSLLPTAVQGQTAAAEIAKNIALANQLVNQKIKDFDVIIIGRGGGSIENLWAFNDELLARAIFASELPVVSAVGHETDFTIADFVADYRAPTPSAAAELLSPDQQAIKQTLSRLQLRLKQLISQQLKHYQQHVKLLQSHLVHPGNRLREHQQRLDELEFRLQRAWQFQLNQQQQRLQHTTHQLLLNKPDKALSDALYQVFSLNQRLTQAVKDQLTEQRYIAKQLSTRLNTISPLATLVRGYSIAKVSNRVITRSNQVKIGDAVQIVLQQGKLDCEVIDKNDAYVIETKP